MTGCSECDCSDIGSLTGVCHVDTGVCSCKTGVTGKLESFIHIQTYNGIHVNTRTKTLNVTVILGVYILLR